MGNVIMLGNWRKSAAPLLVAGLWFCAAAPAQTDDPSQSAIESYSEPYRDVDVAAPEMGVLSLIHAKEGQRVRQGDALAQMDDEVLQASLEIARQTMESAGRLESAQAELEFQEQWLRKLRELHQRDHASAQEVERVLSQRNIAASRMKAAQEEIEVRRLEHHRIEIQLKQRRITSPLDGVVTRIYKDRGEFVSPSDPNVLKVVQLDPLLVVFPAPLTAARQLKPDQEVRVQFDGASDPVRGVVEFISPTPDAQSRTTSVRVRLPNPKEQLPCGAACKLLLDGSGGLASSNR